jgi:8-oxo-dGTP pyrophosphatase MutT (NUDIX family)
MLRDAASLILFKEEADGLRVLMGLRNAGHKFMPNKMVFPGGGVDAADSTAEIAAPLGQAAMARLQRGAGPALAAGLAHAAARELQEETGLSLGTPPTLDGLDYLCRAETPAAVSIRFNARFFVAPAAVASGTLGGSGELELLDWYALERLLQLDLPLVTRIMLVQLQDWHAMGISERESRKAMVFRYPNWEAD